jgi:hypothetical protein
MDADTTAKVRTRYRIDGPAIDQWVAEAAEVGRHRVFYDNHKDAPRGFGVRVTKGGVVSFVINYYAGGSERRATVGRYGNPPHGLSPTAARKKAQFMRDRINTGGDPLAEKIADRSAKSAAKAESARKKGFDLKALLSAYVEHLKGEGRASWKEVERAVARHITEPFPKLSARPADEITVDDVMPVFHKLTKAGVFTEARKLRAYLRAAYTAARKARTDATMFAYAGSASGRFHLRNSRATGGASLPIHPSAALSCGFTC